MHEKIREVSYQYNTKNTSFLKMYKMLNDLEIQNNKFHLVLYDETLMDIDPLDEDNLTVEQKARVLREIQQNFWYFVREIVRIPVPGGVKPYEMHRGNMALNWCLVRNLNALIILPRQNYKSISAVVYYLWLYNFGTTNSEIMFMNKSFDDSKLNLRRIKEIREQLPHYLQVFNPRIDTDNVTNLINGTNNNKIVAKPTATSEAQADNLGRGCTQPSQWYDEFAFLKYNSVIYASATPANSQASLEAKRNNKPYGRLITTTPGDLQTEHGTWCKQFINNSATFMDDMYDWTDEEVKEYILNNSGNNFIFIQYMYYQIGRSEDWFKNQCRELNNDRFKIKREILLDWTKSSDMAIFGEYEIDRLFENAKSVTCLLPLKKVYRLEIFKDFDFRKVLMIGVDTSTGLSQDYSAITVADPDNRLEVVASFKNNNIDTIEFAQLIYELATMYITNGPIIIERNSVGQTIIDYLLKTNIAHRVYYEFKEQKAERKLTDGTVRRSKTKTKVYGISTNNDTRPKMIDLLRTVVNEHYDIVNNKDLIEEIAGLERQRNGKIEHSQTTHDDLLFSYLMCQYAWAYGEKLQEFGIYKKYNTFESDIKSSSEVLTADDAARDFARRFHSVSQHNNDYNRYSGEISAYNIINEYMDEQQRINQFYEEETEMNKNNILNSLMSIYED